MEQSELKEKPSILYRGVIINYNDLKNFKFSGVDLTTNKKPKIDNLGRETIGDGNEYGLYMTDNQTMVYDVYGKPHTDGTNLIPTVLIGSLLTPLKFQPLGFLMKLILLV